MKSKIFLTWNITYNCNYRCTYCHAPKPGSTKTRKVSNGKWGRVWHDIYERYGQADVVISGGEPFVYPGFIKILENITKWHIAEVCTNLDWDVENFISRFSAEKLRVGTSFHPEFAELDDFLKKINKLQAAGFETFVNFVPWPPFLGKMKNYKKKIEAAGTKFILQPFIGDWEGRRYPEGYTEEELAYFDAEIVEDEPNKSIMSFKTKNIQDKKAGKSSLSAQSRPVVCGMGEKYGYILPDGTVRRCCSDETETLGNLIDGTFRFFSKPRICRSSHCHCARRMVVGEEENWKEKWGRAAESV